MYCAHCGKELADDANFCTACGSRSAVAERMAAAEELAPEGSGGVSAALASGRSRSRLRMSPLVLLVLALALTAGIAAAAYYVYTEVYLPSVELESNEPYAANDAVAPTANYSITYESLPGGDDPERFVYPIITSATQNAALDSINEMMRERVHEAASNSITITEITSYDPDRPDDFDQSLRYMTCKYIVTYLDDDVISILGIDYQMHIYNAHGRPQTECITIDLKTGERIAPESVLGINDDELFEATLDVALGLQSAMSNDLQQEVRNVVDDSTERFFLVPSGIALAFNGYDFVGSPAAFGAAVVYSDDSVPGLESGVEFGDEGGVDYVAPGYMNITYLKNLILQGA